MIPYTRKTPDFNPSDDYEMRGFGSPDSAFVHMKTIVPEKYREYAFVGEVGTGFGLRYYWFYRGWIYERCTKSSMEV